MNKEQFEKVRNFKLNELFKAARVPESKRRRMNFVLDRERWDAEAFKILSNMTKDAKSFVENGHNLYIHSTICGNGKTSWAYRMIQEYFESIWQTTDLKCRALFVHVPTFLQAMKDNISEKNEYVTYIKKHISNCDLVVFDDIATKSITQWESDILLSIIDTRVSNCKSCVYTSNLDNNELHLILGDRLYSRIVNGSYNITLVGGDKRGLHINDSITSIK